MREVCHGLFRGPTFSFAVSVDNLVSHFDLTNGPFRRFVSLIYCSSKIVMTRVN